MRRERDGSDRRVCHAYLTQKALDILPVVRETIGRWESGVTSGISADELALLEKLLRKMVDRAEKINKDDRGEGAPDREA